MSINPMIPIPILIIILIGMILLIVFSSRGIQLIIRISIIVILFVIGLRPMLPNGDIEVAYNNFDVCFVIDTSLSMGVKDYNGNPRIDGVRSDINYIMKELSGAHYSIITFDNISSIKVPLTSDYNMTTSYVNALKPIDYMSANSSNITIFKDDLLTILKKSQDKDNRYRVVFIFTDGENTSDSEMDSLSSLKEYVDNGAVLGYGTTNGMNVTYTDYSGEEKVLRYTDSNYNYVDAISKMDEGNMKSMASQLGIDYIHMTKTKNIEDKLKNIIKDKSKADSELEKARVDIYYYFSPLLIILFFGELYIDRRTKL